MNFQGYKNQLLLVDRRINIRKLPAMSLFARLCISCLHECGIRLYQLIHFTRWQKKNSRHESDSGEISVDIFSSKKTSVRGAYC